ncbi:DoxX family protein [Streptomyces orinoci]|uniref:DoxX family protein n=1 Tax=Streptomyces orinoci TaxID=67339 RepID=A0ABV3JQ78_STRON|nr:DoxX family protein [Streptomyces orinoci]
MVLLKAIARPLLSASFLSSGLQTLNPPEPLVKAAAPVALAVAERVPGLPRDARTLVRLNGAVHVVAGTMLALGRFPRIAALTLAASLVPTTLAGHAFWQEEDQFKRMQQKIHFMKNASIMGGLLITAATGGKTRNRSRCHPRHRPQGSHR